MSDQPVRYRFTKRMRLGRRRDFAATYQAKVRRSAGPLLIFARPNDTGQHRLGLSVPRRVGRAVTRNRIKRLIREAFRLERLELPGCFDLVVVVRPHRPQALDDYRRQLVRAVSVLAERWSRRETSDTNGDAA